MWVVLREYFEELYATSYNSVAPAKQFGREVAPQYKTETNARQQQQSIHVVQYSTVMYSK